MHYTDDYTYLYLQVILNILFNIELQELYIK
jgi:hypothetical protein